MALPSFSLKTDGHGAGDDAPENCKGPCKDQHEGPETPNMMTKGSVSAQGHQDTPSPRAVVSGADRVRESGYVSDTLSELNSSSNTVSGIVDTVGSKVRQLARVLKHVEGLVSSLEVRADGFVRERSTLQSKNDHLMITVKRLENDVRVSQQDCRDAQKQVSRWEDKMEDTERDLRRLEEEYKLLEECRISDVFQWDLQKDDLEKEIAMLRGKVRAREEHIFQNAQSLIAMQTKTGELETQIDHLRNINESVIQQCSAQKTELAAALNSLAREQEELVNARESMKSLSEKNAQLYNDVMHAEAAKKDNETRMELLKTETTHISHQLDYLQENHKKDLERSREVLQEVKSCHAMSIMSKDEEIRTQKGLYEAAAADAERLRQQHACSEKKFEKTRISLERDLEQLVCTKTALESTKSTLEAHVRNLEETCLAESNKSRDLQGKLAQALQSIDELKILNNSLQENEGILKSQLEEWQATIKLHAATPETEKAKMATEPQAGQEEDHKPEKEGKRLNHASVETSVRRKIARRMKASQEMQAGTKQ